MKLHKTKSINTGGLKFTEFTSSADGASKARTRLKKLNHSCIISEEVEVDTTRPGLIAFLNDLTAFKEPA